MANFAVMARAKDTSLSKQLPSGCFEVTAVLLEANVNIIDRALGKHFRKQLDSAATAFRLVATFVLDRHGVALSNIGKGSG